MLHQPASCVGSDVGAVVVAYRSAATIPPCVEGLLGPAGADRVVVVDNAGDEATRRACEALGGRFPGRVRYVDPGDNVGYAQAANLGARLLGDAEWLLVANPDVEVWGPLGPLRALAEEKGAALVAGRLPGPGGELNVRRRATPGRELYRALVGSRRAAEVRALPGGPVRVDQLDGAFLLLRGSTFSALGGFDERFELYFEDADLAVRAEALGGSWVGPDVVGTHHGGRSSATARPAAHAAFGVSRLRYLRKHFGARGAAAAAAAALAEAATRSVARTPEGGRARARALALQAGEFVRPGRVRALARRCGGAAERPAGVLVLAVYPVTGATTRLRGAQHFPFLAARGLEGRLWTFLADEDVPAWYGGRTADRLRVVGRGLARLARLPGLVRRASAVVVLREALPFGPPVVERLVARRRPLVWDVDDAVWEPYPGLAGSLPDFVRKTGAKYERLATVAVEVWAGSEVLAEWCRRRNPCVRVVPTVVDVPAEPPPRPSGGAVGWIGSPTTGRFVEAVLPALAGVRPLPRVLVLGADVAPPPGLGVAVEVRPWSLVGEDEALSEMAVGLYPLDPDHPLTDGRCGLKAILYMSRGVPPVVTPTRTNAAIVRDGVEGLHAGSPDAWRAGVQRLLDDPELWRRCSEAAHRRAREEYSLARWGPRVADHLANLVADRGGSPEERR